MPFLYAHVDASPAEVHITPQCSHPMDDVHSSDEEAEPSVYCESSGVTLLFTSQLEGMGIATDFLNRCVVNLLDGSVVTPFERKERM